MNFERGPNPQKVDFANFKTLRHRFQGWSLDRTFVHVYIYRVLFKKMCTFRGYPDMIMFVKILAL